MMPILGNPSNGFAQGWLLNQLLHRSGPDVDLLERKKMMQEWANYLDSVLTKTIPQL